MSGEARSEAWSFIRAENNDMESSAEMDDVCGKLNRVGARIIRMERTILI